MGNFAFAPNEQSTVNLTATTTTANVALPTRASNGDEAVRVRNAGSVDAFMRMGTSSAVTATLTSDYPLGAGEIEIFSCPPSITYIALITASSTAAVYFTLGKGL